MFFLFHVFFRPQLCLVAKQWCFSRTVKRLGQQSTCFVNHLMFFQPSLSGLSFLAAPKDSNSQPGIILVSDCQTRKLAFKLRKTLSLGCSCSSSFPCSHHQDASVKAADKSGMTLVLIAFLGPLWLLTFTPPALYMWMCALLFAVASEDWYRFPTKICRNKPGSTSQPQCHSIPSIISNHLLIMHVQHVLPPS